MAEHRAALIGAMPADQQIHASIVLQLSNQAALTSLLGRLYDPSSPDYRHFLSVAQFTSQFAPTSSDFDAVVAFAQANGFTVGALPANRLVVPITGTAAQMSAAFNVRMNVYQHPTENRTFYSLDREPSVNLSLPVAHIAGLDDFSLPHHMSMKGPSSASAGSSTPSANDQQPATVLGSGPGGSYLGSDMRAAYYGGTTLTGNGQVVGLVEFGGYNLSDVNLTFSNAGQTYQIPINNVLLDNATGLPSGSDAEEALDIVQAIGMAPGLSQVRVYIGVGEDDPAVINSIAAENLAQQIGCSWGWRPADPSVDDVFFQEMAAQGQTFFTASGDSGAFDAAINPFFYPADDQYVTAVGGTHLTTTSAGGGWVSETVWNSGGGGSGGGISQDGISIPSWQTGLATAANGGSTTLRNVPDVAMEADFDNFACSLGVCAGDYAGTSFAAPRWAGFMALVNQQAVEAGNAPSGGLGFMNPAIYQVAQAAASSSDFHDVTVGNNDTANQPLYFNAEPGYDLTTGWGSANGQQLINDLAGPQVPGFWLASSQSMVTANPGGTATTSILVTDAGGFNGNVTFAITSALPSGVTAAFSPNPTTASSVLTLTASSAAPTASQTVTLTGTSGSLTASTNITVGVHPPAFALSALPRTVGINQGASGTSTISVQPQYGFTGLVALSIAGLPAGVTASFSPTSTSGTSSLTLTVSSSATPGTSTLTVTGTSGTLTATTNLTLTVQGPSFSLIGVSSLNMGQGTSSSTYITVEDQFGFTGSGEPVRLRIAERRHCELWNQSRHGIVAAHLCHQQHSDSGSKHGDHHRHIRCAHCDDDHQSGCLRSLVHAGQLRQSQHRPGQLNDDVRLRDRSIWLQRQCKPHCLRPARRSHRGVFAQSHHRPIAADFHCKQLHECWSERGNHHRDLWCAERHNDHQSGCVHSHLYALQFKQRRYRPGQLDQHVHLCEQSVWVQGQREPCGLRLAERRHGILLAQPHYGHIDP